MILVYVCVCVDMWWYSQEPTYSGPYPRTSRKLMSVMHGAIVQRQESSRTSVRSNLPAPPEPIT
jgi:hypothetical protein